MPNKQYFTKDFLFINLNYGLNQNTDCFSITFVHPPDHHHQGHHQGRRRIRTEGDNDRFVRLAHLLKPYSMLLALHPSKLESCYEFAADFTNIEMTSWSAILSKEYCHELKNVYYTMGCKTGKNVIILGILDPSHTF